MVSEHLLRDIIHFYDVILRIHLMAPRYCPNHMKCDEKCFLIAKEISQRHTHEKRQVTSRGHDRGVKNVYVQ